MIFAEIFALLTLATGASLGIIAWSKSTLEKRKAMDDLQAALRSRDHNRLNDWLVMHADKVPETVRKQVIARSAELYIDADK